MGARRMRRMAVGLVALLVAVVLPSCAPLEEVAEVDAGREFTCARHDDGTVSCWGDNGHGQLGDGSTTPSTSPVAASGLTDVVAIGLGDVHACAVIDDGTARCWGYNANATIGDGTVIQRREPVPVADLTDAVAISAGGSHTCALRADGTVRCWGSNGQGAVGDGTTTLRASPVEVLGVTGATAIASGSNHACAVVEDGRVRCWGRNREGQVGDGTTSPRRTTPVEVVGITGAVDVAAGGAHTCARLDDGTARCWGGNAAGQLGDGSTDTRTTPVEVVGLTGTTSLTAGAAHTCATLQTGGVRCWGADPFGQLGTGAGTGHLVPTEVPSLTGATSVAAGLGHTCAVRVDATLRCWGDNQKGQLGDVSTASRATPKPVQAPRVIGSVAEVSSGGHHACARFESGVVGCWGENANGKLGDGTTTTRPTPALVLDVAGAVSVAAGPNHTCAALASGRVRCWGSNGFGTDGWGQLGRGPGAASSVPVAVTGVVDATSVVAGSGHTCALRSTGTVRCWGLNWYGQLGNGTTTNGFYPGPDVPGITGAVALAAGAHHTCALRGDGTAACWGSNVSGTLGDGSTTDRWTPVPVSGLTDAVSVDAGSFHTCARLAGGDVRCWGANLSRQLGDGTTTDRTTPVVAGGGIGGVRDLALGSSHSCAVLIDGSARCWGHNQYGALGDGTTVLRSGPVDVAGLTGATTIAAGSAESWSPLTCVTREDATMRCWGANDSGQVGDGTTTARSSPVPVVPAR